MRRLQLAIIALLAIATVGVGFAIDHATLRFARVEGAGFAARDVVARVELTATGVSAQAEIGEVLLQAGRQRMRNVRIDCASVALETTHIGCGDARIALELPVLGRQVLRASLEYGRKDGSLRGAVRDLRLGHGRASMHFSFAGQRWTGHAQLDRASVQPLMELARLLDAGLPELSGDGIATLRVDVAGDDVTKLAVREVKIAGQLQALTLNNPSGTLASDNLHLDLRADLWRRRDGWVIDADVRSKVGQAYVEPVFLDFGVHAIAASARGRWTDGGELALEQFAIRHTDVLEATGTAQLDMAHEQPVRELRMDVQRLRFPGAYESYLQPYLVDTAFKSMASSGSLRARLAVTNGMPALADVVFDKLTLDDGQRSFALHELDGEMHWRMDEELSTSTPSHLRFGGGTLLGLQLGSSAVRFVAAGRSLRLLEDARIPVFDGVIELESFQARNIATPQVAFIVDATIQPISVSQLCRAFGWPQFGGQVGGVISKLRLRNGVLTLGTTLEAHVFDGVVRLSDLRLEDALGQWPRFYANVGLENLDLRLVTQAFSFGSISGRLSGAVRDLRLFNWSPVSFDASLYTPLDDRSRHRISQRAVQNIGSIGGGSASVTAALSSGFLKFFEEFNYDRLGISCRLENDVCHMNGVAPAPSNGYYLVKGKGIPRIDVIASARWVDWPRLVAQLKAATQSSGPTVE
jgi:hypothetical protein